MDAPTICLDCQTAIDGHSHRCPTCGSPRLISHPELHHLSIAHIDCDAFYASIEKRDNPEIRDNPVIIGGATRGVVSTACYLARVQGVRSAMPMFTALKLCPTAIVISPNMKKYSAVGREIKQLMQSVTPLVESISIDEAFLDLSGTERLHQQSAAMTLVKLSQRISTQIGITVSVGLAANKFLAKVASDLNKPRGFSIIGRAETLSFLARQPVGIIWGVGAAFQRILAKDGITSVGHLQTMSRNDLMRRYGIMGLRLFHLSRGEDTRHVSIDHETKSVSSETTFNTDLSSFTELESVLLRQCERVSKRAKAQGLKGKTVVLKLKDRDFKLITRTTSFDEPTALAHRIFSASRPLLQREIGEKRYRLLGVGLSQLSVATIADDETSLDHDEQSRTKTELAIDRIRAKFGDSSIVKGLALFKSSDGS